MTRVAKPYSNAGVVGIALGALLFTTYVVTGHGLGASGAFSVIAGRTLGATAPQLLAVSPALADRVSSDTPVLSSWIVLELIGVFLGGALSAWLAGRWRPGAHGVTRGRTLRALGGGALMGIGSRLAYGCTSGLALSGGALLATGAWIFIPAAFLTAILIGVALSRRRLA
ncbi:MAG: YeeE/YedE thiosulfate transporter family protein [Gemmatimonadaceae bacterium]